MSRPSPALYSEQANTLRKWTSLLILMLFTTATSIVSQRSRKATASGQRYSVATSVLLSEMLKFGLSFLLALRSEIKADARGPPKHRRTSEGHSMLHSSGTSRYSDASRRSQVHSLQQHVTRTYRTIFNASAWMMGVPSLIYVCQNMLQLVSNSYLTAVAYQGLSQLKLVTAALVSVCLFGKVLNSRQWLCMPILMLGVVLLSQRQNVTVPQALALMSTNASPVHIPDKLMFVTSPFERPRVSGSFGPVKVELVARAAKLANHLSSLRHLIGVVCVLISCVLGSFAGVYIETKLKNAMSVSLAVRNAQLASFAVVLASGAVLLEGLRTQELNPLKNFTTMAWIAVVLRAATGYVVSMTLRYADTIMKGFATSMAIITTIALESLLTFSMPAFKQLLGSALVLISTYQYIRASVAAKA
ncbi:hypothetical protein BCV70DRAFT_163523 [Testicularia cyperi]|uniref:Nucleotide-sugar transporter n=1 Tax=Testicularia cyperi TaxID=1882483 RepID=A0A317XLB7_9BASI|nr:hypothetical protein BCV70DRAFT_163523 [Testicularia cyperi]